MAAPAPPSPVPPSRRDLALGAVVFGVTVTLFWPLGSWLIEATYRHDQLQNAAIIAVAAVAAIAWGQGTALRPGFAFTRASLVLLTAAYVLMAGAVLASLPVLMLVAFVCGVAALLRWLFPAAEGALLRAAVVGLAGFLVLFLAFPVLDRPLRWLAGVEAARLLQELGFAAQLAIQHGPDPKLLLLSAGRIFEVAPECNGFGLISSSVLLALVVAQAASGVPLWWRIASVPAAVLVAFLFNLLRILVIVLLTPRFPAHYDVLHEIAGITALWSCLGLVWFLTAFRFERR